MLFYSTTEMYDRNHRQYSLMMAALLVSFLKRKALSFLTRSSSTSQTTSDSL